MSPEEVQRTMQCLLHSQAQFEAHFARLSEKTDALSEKTDRIADAVVALTGIANQTERKVAELTASLGAVRDGLIGLTGIVGRIEQRAERREDRFFQRLERLIESSFKTERKPREKSRSSETRRRP